MDHNVPGIETAGYEVVAVDHTVDALTELFTEAKVVCNTVGPFAKYGHEVVEACINAGCHYLDTTGEQDWVIECDETYGERMAEKGLLLSPGIGQMYSNAGIATVNPLVRMTLEEWRSVLAVDLDGVFLCTKHAALAMAGNGGGSIIKIASIKAFGGSPATGHYGAAKAGVVSLTKTAALELRRQGVRVNAICPGWVRTDMVLDRKQELEAALGVDFGEVIGHIQGRLGEPEEIAGLALFLASDRSRFSSGTAYVVDGGATASLV